MFILLSNSNIIVRCIKAMCSQEASCFLVRYVLCFFLVITASLELIMLPVDIC